VATAWNDRRNECSGSRKDAVLLHGGRSAKQQLSTQQNQHDVVGFVETISTSESKCEICTWEGQEAL
jgi:hypothetical protein